MFSKEMEALIEATLQDGVLTDQEKAVLIKRAQKEGIDVDELDVYIQSLLQKRHQAEAEEDARNDRQSKMGSVKKCPHCGQPVQAGWAACPMCGFAFNVEENSASFVKFSEQISSMDTNMGIMGLGSVTGSWLKKIQQKANVIETYPVPNNRMALLEFLSQLKVLGNINGKPAKSINPLFGQKMDDSKLFSLSYWKLFEKCIYIAKRSFANDPDFKEYFEYYEEQVTNNKKGFFSKLFGK